MREGGMVLPTERSAVKQVTSEIESGTRIVSQRSELQGKDVESDGKWQVCPGLVRSSTRPHAALAVTPRSRAAATLRFGIWKWARDGPDILVTVLDR